MTSGAMRAETLSIGDYRLESGTVLPAIEVAYVAIGQLNASRANCVLLTHGYTSGPEMIANSGVGASEGSWSAYIGEGRPFDPARHFIVCSNMLGSSFGTTGPGSIDPATGKPWGPSFPDITVRDIVGVQHAFVRQLGVERLKAVVGPSYGGFQALQWALDFPTMVEAAGCVVSGLTAPAGLSGEGQRRRFASIVGWNDGWHGGAPPVIARMEETRCDTLNTYGMARVLCDQGLSEAETAERIREASRKWARTFDPNSLIVLARAAENFDVRAAAHRIRARVLFANSSSDVLFPPNPEIRQLFTGLGDQFRCRVIESNYGHLASGADWRKLTDDLHWLMA